MPFENGDSTILFRINRLLKNGYKIKTPAPVEDTIWMEHDNYDDLRLTLYPNGMIVLPRLPEKENVVNYNKQHPLKRVIKVLDENNEGIDRIYEDEGEKFLSFIASLPRVNFVRKILRTNSFYFVSFFGSAALITLTILLFLPALDPVFWVLIYFASLFIVLLLTLL